MSTAESKALFGFINNSLENVLKAIDNLDRRVAVVEENCTRMDEKMDAEAENLARRVRKLESSSASPPADTDLPTYEDLLAWVAKGDALDELAALWGLAPRRTGETDDAYRRYVADNIPGVGGDRSEPRSVREALVDQLREFHGVGDDEHVFVPGDKVQAVKDIDNPIYNAPAGNRGTILTSLGSRSYAVNFGGRIIQCSHDQIALVGRRDPSQLPDWLKAQMDKPEAYAVMHGAPGRKMGDMPDAVADALAGKLGRHDLDDANLRAQPRWTGDAMWEAWKAIQNHYYASPTRDYIIAFGDAILRGPK